MNFPLPPFPPFMVSCPVYRHESTIHSCHSALNAETPGYDDVSGTLRAPRSLLLPLSKALHRHQEGHIPSTHSFGRSSRPQNQSLLTTFVTTQSVQTCACR